MHIYGSYFATDGIEGLVQAMKKTPYTTRAWNSYHPSVWGSIYETMLKLEDDPDYMLGKDSKRRLAERIPGYPDSVKVHHKI